MTDSFLRFMVSPAGRATRVAAGLGLLTLGLSRRQRSGGRLAAALSLIPLGAGALDVCALGPLLGAPLSGAEARASL